MTPQQIEAMKQALEALEEAWYHVGTFQPTEKAIDLYDEARAAIKEALAQTQEPVATVESVATVVSESGNQEVTMSWWHEPALPVGTKLYTTPPQRTEQEPFCLHWEDRWGCNHYADPKEPHPVNAKPLYTTPPQEQQSCDKRTWVGLTDEQRSQLVTLHHGWNEYGQAIEASLKQQNGYAEENT